MGPDPVFACPAQAAVAKAVERRVLALVAVVFLVQLLDQDLDLVVGQRRCNVFQVVLHQGVVPVDWNHLLEVDADVEECIVACAFWHALGAQCLQAWWAVLDRVIRLFGLFGEFQVGVLDPLVVELVELFEGCSRAIVLDGIAHCLVAAKIRQVQEVAGVTTVHQDFSLLGEYLAACLAQEGSTGFEEPLHLSSGDWFFGE